MQINIYKDKLLGAHLFGASVLYSVQPIPREDVPQGWYCYDLRGTVRHPDEPYALVDRTEDCHAGSVLSCLPLKSGRSQKRLVKNMFQMLGTNPTLAEFCATEKIRCPETPLRHMLCPASPEDAGLFYAQPPERDEELGTIGHIRIDFGSGGKAFHHSWWPRGPEELNTQEFRDELDKVVNDLRKSVLKDLASMRRYCYGSEGAIEGGSCCQNYGFTLKTERYLYRLRCNPIEGDYQGYLSCFDKQAQKQAFGLTEKGCQMLQEAADPSMDHSYSWYVIENINDPEHQVMHELPLGDAIQLYASLDCEDKRLGVTKDDIAAVDLVIRWEGCEWLSKDRLTMDSFKDDPVVADAVDQLQQMLEENTARQCIAGLNVYAAQLAAKHQEEQLPRLRELCVEMADFWGLDGKDAPKRFQETAKQYDSAVSAVQTSSHVPELSQQEKQNILDGLELYAQEMVFCGGLEKLISECDMLAIQLRTQWEMEMSPSQRTTPRTEKPDCALIGEDGNIFNLSGIAACTLRENGLPEQADELLKRIFDGECDSYAGALRVISEYVNITEPEEHSMQIGGM